MMTTSSPSFLLSRWKATFGFRSMFFSLAWPGAL